MNLFWTTIAALIGALISGLVVKYDLLPSLWHWIKLPWDGRRQGQVTFILGLAVVSSFALWVEVIEPCCGDVTVEPRPEQLINNYRWITYEPEAFNPGSATEPSLESIERELGWISDAGFTGIITFASRGVLSSIPELAKKRDLAVIMGIWDPKDEGEVDVAISKREFVDGYSVGFNRITEPDGYSFEDLEKTISHIRSKTKRPVSTTAKPGEYARDKRLLTVGDWVFPDAHTKLQLDSVADAVRDVSRTIEIGDDIAGEVELRNRPILLTLVTYAVGGVENATAEEQAKFFAGIFEARIDGEIPAVAVHSSFDTPWKIGKFNPWDPFTGLFEVDGTPRPAVKEIMDRSR